MFTYQRLKILTSFANSCLDFISEISQHLADIHCTVSRNTEALPRSKLAQAGYLEHLVTLLWNKGRGKADYIFQADGRFFHRNCHMTKWRISLGDLRAHNNLLTLKCPQRKITQFLEIQLAVLDTLLVGHVLRSGRNKRRQSRHHQMGQVQFWNDHRDTCCNKRYQATGVSSCLQTVKQQAIIWKLAAVR